MGAHICQLAQTSGWFPAEQTHRIPAGPGLRAQSLDLNHGEDPENRSSVQHINVQ